MRRYDLLFTIAMPTYDEPGDGAGGGGGTGSGGTGDGTGGTGDGVKPGAGGAGDGAGGVKTTPGQGGAAQPNPWDTEKRGLLTDLGRERKTRQEFEKNQTKLQADLDAANKRIRALAGVAPEDKNADARAAIQAEIAEMYPALKQLTPEQVAKVLAVAEKSDSLEAAVNHHWTSHAQKMVDSAQAAIEKQIGGKLSDRQLTRMTQLYLNEAQQDQKFLARHEAGDAKLIEEFVASFVEDFFEPGRRSALADITRRQRPVPNGKGQTISVGGKQVNLKDPKAFEDAMVSSFQEHGGKFGD